MSGYTLKIISVLLLIWSNTFLIIAGETEDRKKTFYGFYLDLDLAEPFMSMLSSNKSGLNASIQADFFHAVFPIVEIGYSKYQGASDYAYIPDIIVQPDNYKYNVDGIYYKIGVDFNLIKKDRTKKINSIGYLGIRYAVSPFKYEIENLAVEDFYWEQSYRFDAKGTTTGQWAEFVAGVKTPVYKNLCLGVDVRFKQFLYIQEKQTGDKAVRQSYAPGFGDKNDGKWGFRYTISYFFPFTK